MLLSPSKKIIKAILQDLLISAPSMYILANIFYIITRHKGFVSKAHVSEPNLAVSNGLNFILFFPLFLKWDPGKPCTVL